MVVFLKSCKIWHFINVFIGWKFSVASVGSCDPTLTRIVELGALRARTICCKSPLLLRDRVLTPTFFFPDLEPCKFHF